MRLSEQFTLSWAQVDFDRRLHKADQDEERVGAKCSSEQHRTRGLGIAARQWSHTSRPIRSFRVQGHTLTIAPGSGLRSKRSGITNYTWHWNRHTFCSWLAMAGVSIKGDSSPGRPQDDQHVGPLRTPLARGHSICVRAPRETNKHCLTQHAPKHAPEENGLPFVEAIFHVNSLICWCPEGDLNPHGRLGPADFKSAASANFAIRAWLVVPHQLSYVPG